MAFPESEWRDLKLWSVFFGSELYKKDTETDSYIQFYIWNYEKTKKVYGLFSVHFFYKKTFGFYNSNLKTIRRISDKTILFLFFKHFLSHEQG